MSRPRDLSFEALVEATNASLPAERGILNAALKQIREATPDLDDGDLAALIRMRAEQYRRAWPEMALTPTALSKHWSRIEVEQPKPAYPTPNPTPGTCPTCGGVKMVLVGTRPSMNPLSGHDLMAACPDCNAEADVGFWRADGTRFVPPDPGRVRQMMEG